MNVEIQVEYWRTGAREDWDVGADLVTRGKTRHGLFFLHLALEKALKGLVCRATNDVAPKIHTLLVLAERAGLSLSDEQADFLAEFDRYNIEGRYPQFLPSPPDQRYALEQMQRAQEMFSWLADR